MMTTWNSVYINACVSVRNAVSHDVKNNIQNAVDQDVINVVWNVVWNILNDDVSKAVNTKLLTYDFAKQNE